MPPRPRRNADTGAVRRDAKRRRASSSRWMHLSAAEVSSRTVIERAWAINNRAVARVTYFAAVMLALRQAVLHADPAIATAIQPVITLLVAQIAIYSQAANSHRNLDRLLYDIPDKNY